MHGDVGVHYVVGNARSVGRYVDDSVKMQVSDTECQLLKSSSGKDRRVNQITKDLCRGQVSGKA